MNCELRIAAGGALVSAKSTSSARMSPMIAPGERVLNVIVMPG